MKKARLLLPLFLLFGVPMTAQIEHAPTPEQCRADANDWGIPRSGVLNPNEEQFSKLVNSVRFNSTVTAKTLEARNAEFAECQKTDRIESIRYGQAARAYTIAELTRMADFMRRHNLQEQFHEEDEQGKR